METTPDNTEPEYYTGGVKYCTRCHPDEIR